MSSLSLMVRQIDSLTPRIRRLLLVSTDSRPLPTFTPGAHVELHVPGERIQRRAYSLVNEPGTDYYEIAVQLEENSSGGSRWVHSLSEGQVIQAESPSNQFPLSDSADHFVLIAGGIGITPMLGMARALKSSGKTFSLHYSGRTPESMAYLDEVKELEQSNLWITNGDSSKRFPARSVLADPKIAQHLYICGPNQMVNSVLQEARELGWKDDQLHYEVFTGALEQLGDKPFDVFLKESGLTLTVNPDQTVLDAMLEAGLDPMFDCRRGDCGVCVAQVLEGEADHRDICLSERERSLGSFCPCVSRATSERLVLDI